VAIVAHAMRRHPIRAGIVVVLATALSIPSTLQLVGAATSRSAKDRTAPNQAAVPRSVSKLSTAGGSAKFNGIDLTDNPCTTVSTDYVDIPGTSVRFSFGGQVNRSVLVLFQGEWIPNSGRALIRLLIDGVVQSGPGDASSPFAAHEGTGDDTNGFNFISDPLTPGVVHTATIQWESVFGDSICVDERSLVVLHS
jgi:hypothetical protein